MKRFLLAVVILCVSGLNAVDEFNYFRGWDDNSARAGRLHIKDKRKFGTVSFIVSPQSEVIINGEFYGKGRQDDIVLPVGKYNVEIRRNENYKGSIVIKSGHHIARFRHNMFEFISSNFEKIYGTVSVTCNKKVTVYKRVFKAMVSAGKTPFRETCLSMVKCIKVGDKTKKSKEVCAKVNPEEETEFVFSRSRYGFNFRKINHYTRYNNERILKKGLAGRKGYTSFYVRSNRRASIFVDDKFVGVTSFPPKYVVSGKHIVKIRSIDKTQFYVKKHYFKSRGKLVLDVVLIEKGKGAVTIDSYPSGKIYMGNRCLGYGPRRALQMKPGRYSYKIVAKELGVMSNGEIFVRKDTHRLISDFLRDDY